MIRKSLHLGVVGLSLALTGCVHESWTYKAVPNVTVARKEVVTEPGPFVVKLAPESTAAPESPQKSIAAKRTVLMAAWQKDLGSHRSSVGRTLLVTLDGPPTPGQYWITSENAVLVTYSAYQSPTPDSSALTGSIKILEVNGDQIVADVAVRDANLYDPDGFIDEPYDAAQRQWPFKITGRRTFTVTNPQDPAFVKAEVKWMPG